LTRLAIEYHWQSEVFVEEFFELLGASDVDGLLEDVAEPLLAGGDFEE
jgi:hypothetical protein